MARRSDGLRSISRFEGCAGQLSLADRGSVALASAISYFDYRVQCGIGFPREGC